MKKLVLILSLTCSLTAFAQIVTQASNLTSECGDDGIIQNWLNSNGGAMASTECGTVVWSNDFSGTNGLCSEQITVTFTATNTCGSFETLAVLTLQDTQAPTIINPPVDIVIECGDNDTIPELLAEDNCSSAISITFSEDSFNGSCPGEEITSRTWTATDDCGNSSSYLQTISFVDYTSPNIITSASDVTVSCDGSGNVSDINNWLATNGGAIASDTCSDVSWTNDFTSIDSDCTEIVSTTVTFFATDGCGNTSSTQATFTIGTTLNDCPDASIVLTTQAEVDAFAINYPNCTELNGLLSISGVDISDLSPLSEITSVQQFFISNNPLLESLNGLSNLDSVVEVFSISGNQNLTSLEGMTNLNYLGELTIDNNDSLVDFSGITFPQQIGSINVRNNDALISFDGISSSSGLAALLVVNNPLLSDASALNSVSINSFLFQLEISENPSLSVCSLSPVCDFIELWNDSGNPNTVVIENNANGCNSISEVETECAISCPSGQVTLNSQAEVDAFAINYPNCTSFLEKLVISGNDITDLYPLSGISEINDLEISGNNQLTTLQGLNLSSFILNDTQLRISNNSVLNDISALNSLNSNSSIYLLNITNNPMLTSLTGLEKFSVIYIFNLIDNDSLTNLTGLNNLTSLNNLSIMENDNLVNLVGLDSFEGTNISGFLIQNNATLQNLVGLTDSFLGNIKIIENPLIQTLEGLEVAVSHQYIEIDGNDSLIDISAINALNTLLGVYNFKIKNNPNLSTCNIEAVCSAFDMCSSSGVIDCTVTIENNGSGCNSVNEIENTCAGNCPSDTITLTTQAEVDAFPILYPNCTALIDSLIISGNDITDLTPLSSISSIEFGLSIINNPLLTSLNGLNLVNINDGGIHISNNALLQSISSLSSLTSINPGNYYLLEIKNNPALISLDGLQNFQVSYITRIDNNDALVDLSGLENLYCEELHITNNQNLQSFDGLTGVLPAEVWINDNPLLNNVSSIEAMTTDFSDAPLLNIKNNPNLSTCNIIPFCNSIGIVLPLDVLPSTFFEIENNAAGCNSIQEVAIACGISSANDDCENAIGLALGEITQAYNELGTQSPQIPSCNDSANRIDVWFSFTTTNSGMYDIVVEGGVYNLQLWEGDCTNLTQVPDTCGVNELLDANVQFNTTYYLQVWSDGTDRATGLFDVAVYDTTLSVQEDEFDAFVLFPNPVHSKLQFKAADMVSSISVLNALGQKVLSSFPKSTNGFLDISELSSGLYFVKVEINNKYSTFRVIKD